MYVISPSYAPKFERISCWVALRSGLLLLTAGLLSACASGPKFSANVPPKDGHAVIYIYRKLGVFGVAMQPDIFVDGQEVGDLPAGGYLRVEVVLASGPRHVFVGGRSCIPLSTSTAVPGSIKLKPGSTFYVELDIKAGNQPMGDRYVWANTCRLQVAEPNSALAALPSLNQAH